MIPKFQIHKRLTLRNGGLTISGLSKCSPLSSLVHDGVFKSGHELTKLIVESCCNVSNDIQPLNFTKTPVDFIPDEFIISTQQVQLELEKINHPKATVPLVVQSYCIKSYIDPYQFGYLNNCSTTHALIHLIHRWLAALDKPSTSIKACMIDFSKAFDRIDHNILLHKLQQLDTLKSFMPQCVRK